MHFRQIPWLLYISVLFSTLKESIVGKIYIYTNINVTNLEPRPVSNKRSGDFSFFKCIHEFLDSPSFQKITAFLKILCFSFYFTEFYVKWKLQLILKNCFLKFKVAVSISPNFLWNGNYNIEFRKNFHFSKIEDLKNSWTPLKNAK